MDFREEFLPIDDPAGAAFTAEHHDADPDYFGRLPLESAVSMMEFRPVDVVQRIAPRAVLVVHGDGDPRVPLPQSLGLYRRAEEPKALRVPRCATHHDVTNSGPRFPEVLALSREWFDRHLVAPRDAADPPPTCSPGPATPDLRSPA